MTGQNRLFVLAVLVLSLVITLAARAVNLQVLAGPGLSQAAAANRLRDVVLPAARGMILDQQGRPLAANVVKVDVTADRRALLRLPADGDETLAALAQLVGEDISLLRARTRNCGTQGASPRPNCWNGAPAADPVLVADIDVSAATAITDNPKRFPGVSVVTRSSRAYPGEDLAAQVLGYVAAVDAQDVAADAGLTGSELVGRAGLEAQYDEALRGRPGAASAVVDSAGHRIESTELTPATAGLSLVTSIDLELQEAVQESLARAMARARGRVDRVTGRNFEADSGAAVVLDVRTGRVLALASAPDYDANVWVDGISATDYDRLTAPESGQPMLSRAIQAAAPPASTFKVVSTAAALGAGYSPWSYLPCPASYQAGGRAFRNYESRAHGPITFARALEVSCDTIYYRIAHQMWRADGGSDPVAQPADAISTMAAEFGFGARTGIDLPGEAAGSVASRTTKRARWEANSKAWCQRARDGYPEVADRERAGYLAKLAAENCTEGMTWRVGDAVNAAIGQGDTIVTPLQLAAAYAAIANGGTLWRPQVGAGLLHADGTVAAEFPRQSNGTLPLDPSQLAYLRQALRGVIETGTARKVFADFPTSAVPLAGKTGTAEVYGRQTTSWFASFAPADDPKYAVVAMVSQAGTGAGTSGRVVKGIYEALFGVVDGRAGARPGVLAGGDAATELPTLTSDGQPVAPVGGDRAVGGQ